MPPSIIRYNDNRLSPSTVELLRERIGGTGWRTVTRDEITTTVLADFGVSGDGSEQTSELQAAIDGSSGGVCYLPAGTYAASNLIAPTDGGPIRIIGDGPEKTVLRAASGATGILLDLTFASGRSGVEVRDLSIDLQLSPTMIGVRTQRCNRLALNNVNFRYGTIGWQNVSYSGTGPFLIADCNFQNQTTAAFNLTGSSGLGSAGSVRDSFIQVTNSSVAMDQGVLIDWFTTGVVFSNIQILANVDASLLIHSGFKYSTAAPTGGEGAFLYFDSCVTDQIDTGNGLDLTNARGVWVDNSFFSVNPGSNTDGVAITAGFDQYYSNTEISGRGMSFTSAPDRIVIGSGCVFPQTSTGGALVMPGSNPPTNLKIAPDVRFFSSITNLHGTLETALKNNWNYGRAGNFV